eukprot:CAMPEP_0198335624 /NCGR_PEP_ID=MMETSP1450-20131203/20442_1 /TAXON_ID=753684 ORGANISM="Madagascaria erythrocladiodes, Strain CCMP3234" /NCGR_SAMPLE_ID=MMETSP1450 /ASSEMBLY_ACC=CAM_ASM_001115 /LENGTH=59 /DNA_ID=CAMNT_0044040305 /DNA_START=111 /DNA_END=287 /DNA_ORIENTATION=-
MGQVTGMQAFFDWFTADPMEEKIARLAPSGVAFCEALADPNNSDIDVKLGCTVTAVEEV